MESQRNPSKGKQFSQKEINQAIRAVCKQSFGVLDSNFMCQSVMVLAPKSPLCISGNESVEHVIELLRENKIGCILITDPAGKLIGIFSERDVILKVTPAYAKLMTSPVSQVMTRDPVTQPPETTIGFALNLMSQGGFRHIPIVDSDGVPTGLISIKDVVDYIVGRFVEDTMAFQAETSN